MDIFLAVFLILLFLVLFSISFLPILFRGAIYLPSKKKIVKKMIELAKIKSGEKAADLGAGDGRLIIALARAGAEAHGYEINPLLVWLAKTNIRKAGFENKAFIHFRSFWHENFSEFDIVTIYGIGYAMKKLEPKLKQELKPRTRIVSNCFTFPNWPKSKKEDGIYLYEQI